MSLKAQLLSWYDRQRRDLPWRRTADPWAIWVSEVMLQQTRVETVLAYYEPFLSRFPTVHALAAAALDEVLVAWSGLGYYRRARSLHAAARRVVAAGGGLPARAAEWASLPGVGDYTAAAIASIAQGEVVPVLDGNVERVLSRRLALADASAGAAARRRLLAAAGRLLDAERPGDSNQALMELGATVCSPRAPDCRRCPLARGCRARAGGRMESYPRRRSRPAPRRERQVAALVSGPDGGLLLVRRGEGETVLPGLWEAPTVVAPSRSAAERELGRRYGGCWRLGERSLRLRHSVTFRAIELEAWSAEWTPAAVAEGAGAGWFTPEQAAGLALTGLTRKLLARRRGGD